MFESLDDFLTDDHNRLDELIAAFQERKDESLLEAAEFLAEFTAALLRHLVWEETILFPLYEQKTAQTALTNTLRSEHDEMREWLTALNEKVEEGDVDCDHEAAMLVNELGAHNGREEQALYPQLDKLLSDAEKQATFEQMSAVE
jgi:regulator of cell morphogenesis and NO signaling